MLERSYSEKPNKMQQCIKFLLFLILSEAQHVSGVRYLTTSNNCTPDNLPRMQNQMLLVQF